jgi:hypothetical protein
MDVNGGKGLRHGKMMTNCGVVRQSQRDCGLQPKVGAPAPTLGYRKTNSSTTTWLWQMRRDATCETKWPQPRCGWK